MILSFSIESMRPMIEAGIRQANGEDVGPLRVKRQTSRAESVRYERLLEDPERAAREICHLWWKSRTPEREKLGASPMLSIDRLWIWYARRPYVFRNGARIDAYQYVHDDGFDDLYAMLRFFNCPTVEKPWRGVLIKW